MMSSNNTVLYIGTTSNIIKRVWEHKNNLVKGFTAKYRVHKLVYFEVFQAPYVAISREKKLKNWHREWKMNLIRADNPDLNDLYEDLL